MVESQTQDNEKAVRCLEECLGAPVKPCSSQESTQQDIAAPSTSSMDQAEATAGDAGSFACLSNQAASMLPVLKPLKSTCRGFLLHARLIS